MAAAEFEVATLCHRRGKGEPLQYVLGTQPFGNLELMCRPGVLIPRCVVLYGLTRRPSFCVKVNSVANMRVTYQDPSQRLTQPI